MKEAGHCSATVRSNDDHIDLQVGGKLGDLVSGFVGAEVRHDAQVAASTDGALFVERANTQCYVPVEFAERRAVEQRLARHQWLVAAWHLARPWDHMHDV